MGKSHKTSVRAKCPRCGSVHRHYFENGGFWSGKGIPRYYCSACQRLKDSPYDIGLERCYSEEIYYDLAEYEAESQTITQNYL